MNRYALIIGVLGSVFSASAARAVTCAVTPVSAGATKFACESTTASAVTVVNNSWSAFEADTSSTFAAIYANNSNATNGLAVDGASTAGIGVRGTSGGNSPNGIGVRGQCNAGAGVSGVATTGLGVGGSATTGTGVWGATTGASSKGVYGLFMPNPPNAAILGYGVFGGSTTASGYAGYFSGNVHITGTLTGGNSDIRLKKNVKVIDGALEQLLKLRGVTYEWKDPESRTGPGTHWGFIAQDVEKIFPGWVKSDPEGYKTLDMHEVQSLVVESVRSLDSENRTLHAELSKLEKRLSSVEGKKQPIAAGVNSDNLGYFGFGVAATALILSRRKRNSAEQR